MNGDMNELYNKLKTEFEVLRAIVNERWKAHNVQTEQEWGAANEKIADIRSKITAILKKTDELKGIRNEVIVHRLLIIIVILSGIVFGIWMR